jgi:hypothetical protein
MPKHRRKASKRKYRLRESSGDLLSVQIAIRLRKVPKGMKFTREMLEGMIRRKAMLSSGEWITTGPGEGYAQGCKAGPNPPGIELTIIKWQNPERRGTSTGWRYPVTSGPTGQGQDEAWGTLRRPITSGSIAVQFIR